MNICSLPQRKPMAILLLLVCLAALVLGASRASMQDDPAEPVAGVLPSVFLVSAGAVCGALMRAVSVPARSRRSQGRHAAKAGNGGGDDPSHERLRLALAQAEARVAELEREAVKIAGREHRRIGEYLHDNIGQLVTGIGFLSESLVQRMPEGEAQKLALEIRSLAVQVMSETRHLSRGFFAVDLESQGLGYALAELSDFIRKTFGVECSYAEPKQQPRIRADQAGHLYRIVQEGINNALKHGEASRISVSLTADDGEGNLTVWNNGKPFRPGNSQGVGLLILEDRATRIGGKITFSSEEEGVRMICTFPLLDSDQSS
jgi:signal transduction histidine kinase